MRTPGWGGQFIYFQACLPNEYKFIRSVREIRFCWMDERENEGTRHLSDVRNWERGYWQERVKRMRLTSYILLGLAL